MVIAIGGLHQILSLGMCKCGGVQRPLKFGGLYTGHGIDTKKLSGAGMATRWRCRRARLLNTRGATLDHQ